MLDIHKIEKKWQNYWEKEKIYKFNQKSKKKIFSIDTPPPTVSGKMHMGHAFSYAQMDFIARYKRMQGYNLFYPFGTDDNGLPTERLIESEKKVKAQDMKREQFIKLCLTTLVSIRKKYIEDFKKIALSCDYDIFYSTINDHCRKISQLSFIQLYKQGREYRKEAPVIWCPECQTAIAQVELEDKELTTELIDVVFQINKKDIIISTTRPELLVACVAIFAHPNDKRYKELIGKKAAVPLFKFKVPILKDLRVDMEKGTGIVMCCTFGDQTDVDWYKAHKLPLKTALTKDGRMTKLAKKYSGLTIKEARKEIIQDLKKQNLIKKQKQITHIVNVHERCGTPIEFIHSKQWFIKYLDLKKDFLKNGKQLNWYPKFMINRLENWIKGLQWDWCISRQIPFGIPFPVWYCKKCDEVILATPNQLPVDPLIEKPPIKKCKCGSTEFIPEKDIINTWATSSLTPQLAVQLMPKKLWKKLFPMSLRPQAHDIISFWLFNTLVKSQLHYKKNPWKDVMISGWALDPKGKKMSKSRGNVIEPQEIIKKYSTDCLRFWASSSKLGEDLPFHEKELVSGKKFVNKLLNSSRFVFMNMGNSKPKKPKKLEEIDKLFLQELNRTIFTTTYRFEQYNYSRAKFNTEEFFWKFFCDNYLEIVKKRVYNGKGNEKLSAQYTLYQSLLTILKLIAPIMPHITEEIYQQYFKKYEKIKSIHTSEWPKYDKKKLGEGDKKLFPFANKWYLLIDIISKVRQKKTLKKKAMNAEIILTIEEKYLTALKGMLKDLKNVTNAKEIKQGKFSIKLK